jgi:N-acetylglutamate synthase-like GNAT family acetyltransferase
MTDIVIRSATPDDASAIDALIREHQTEGHLLPRDVNEIRGRAGRFVVGESGGRIAGCAELAPLSGRVAEIRSLVVRRGFRRSGLSTRLLAELQSRAKAQGFATLSAFTHDPKFFLKYNFSLVPHLWVPEKLAKDCHACPLFRQCGQHAMVLSLVEAPRVSWAPTAPRRIAVA